MSTKDPRNKGRAVGETIVSLFDKMSIRDEAAVDIAIAQLDHLLPDPRVDMNEVVEAIDSVKYLLEFIVCVSSDYGFELLSSGIMKLRPNTAEEFPSSTLYKLLAQFSVSLYLPYQRISDAPPELIANRRSVDLAFSVLQAITLLNASDTLAEETVDVSSTRWAAKNKEKQEKRRKRSIHIGRAPAIDVKAIVEYGAEVPTSKPQAVELAATVIAEQMSVLRDFFSIFRKEETIAFFKRVYLPLPPLSVAIPSQHADNTTSAVSPIIPLPSASQGAFPLVQPMKAALYFDNAEGFGPWRVKMSGRAERDLRQWRKRDAVMFDIIVGKIKVLSNGNFTDDSYKQLVSHGGEVEVPIYEAKMTKNTRLLYQIHCDIDFEDNVERQVIRVFGVYKHDEINAQFWNTMSRQLNCRGAEYKKRCIFRNKALYRRGEYTVLPAEFPVRSSSEQEVVASPSTDSTGLTKEDMESLHALLTLEKFVTFSQAFLNTILAEQDVSHVFDVSHREKEIIEHDSSCFVIGRSGTGKTTTMVFKILGIERTYDTGNFRGAMEKPRQVFVTQSQDLAKKVEEYYAKLHQSHATAHLSPSQLKDMASKNRARRDRMVDEDEEIIYTSTLPRRYGALDDSHFPLFLTFSHLCRLLEGEFRYLVEQEKVDANKASRLRDIMKLRPRSTRCQTVGYMQDDKDSFLDYDKFCEVYWKHFPENPLNPDLVWGEFMAIIKGSEGAMKSDTGYLDKETYVGLGHRGTQTSSPGQREDVYKLFEVYMRRKKLHSHYDPADRTRMLIRSLKVTRVPGKAVDFLYVDEVQDNFLIDSLVLKAICSNPHGLFWAGDTAQTIAPGSSFRFKDLKTLLYGAEEASLWAKRARPETFYLTTNYRSHAGIVNCADSIVQLITEYWPDTIDRLPQEKGTSPGSKPMFFSDQDAARLQQSLFRDSSGGGAIEFGARQCILVRDLPTRERLKAEFGKIGQVLTVYESKGLEFDDVLLYNFFEDSTVSYSQWRVLLNSVPGCMAPDFDDGRHSGVCRELKNLYVAITRARQNLWITDCSENAYPLKRIWAERGLVEEHAPGAPVPTLAMRSGKEEWDEAARLLFVKRQYSEAIDAFERADRPQERLVALAYSLREEARTSFANARGRVSSQSSAFATAAEAFIDAGRGALEPEDQRTYYRIAAECYVRSGDNGRAGAAYRDAAEYTLAAQHFRKAGKFEEAIDVIKQHQGKMQADVVESIVDVSRLYFLREKQMKKAMELFDNDDDALEYMDDYGLDVARAQLLEEVGRYTEAADIHISEGNTLDAIRVLSLDTGNEPSLKHALECLLDGLWRNLSCGVPVNEEALNPSGTIGKLLSLTAATNGLRLMDVADDVLRDEIMMFRAIAERNMQQLLRLGERFASQGRHRAAFLCLDRVFSVPLKLQASTIPEISGKLKTFLTYARMLQTLGAASNPCEDPDVRKLFALQLSSEDLLLLPKCSLLANERNDRLTPSIRESDQGLLVPRSELEKLIKHVLKTRLLKRVNEENVLFYSLRSLQPCLSYSMFHHCNLVDCPRSHIDSQQYDAVEYNTRVRVHILQILIYQTLYAVENSFEHARHQLHWLRQLYDTIYPPFYKLGSVHVLSPPLIPEFELGRQVVNVWVRDRLYALDPWQCPQNAFLTSLIQASRLALMFDRDATAEYLPRIPSVMKYRPPALLQSRDKAYVVHYFLDCMQDSDERALNKGVLFMNHVLENKVPIDIGVLCDFMDHLCGALIVASRIRATGTLHDVTLPKSWLSRLSPNIDALRTKDTYLEKQYKAQIIQLLEPIYTGHNVAHLLFEGRELSDIGHRMRDVFFVRICRSLCLWGYNFQIFAVRNQIVKAITSIRIPGRMFSPIVGEYVSAKSWQHLARIVRTSVKDSSLDEMVQLHVGTKPVERKSLFNVRRVVYNRLDDIPWLLKTDRSLSAPAGLRAEAPSFIPAGTPEHTTQPEEDAEIPGADDAEDETVEHADLEDIAQVDSADYATVAPKASTAQEIAAYKTIAEAYQQYRALKRVNRKSSEETRRRVFASFAAQAAKMDWPHQYYCLLFLGPVPHLYIVVESMKNHLHEARSVAKKRFNVAAHLELENMQSSLTQMNRSFKDVMKLHQSLGPTSDLHKTRDLDKLKACALEAETLMRSLPTAKTLDWEKDMKIALRGIVEVKKVPMKQPKPALNVEDLEDC